MCGIFCGMKASPMQTCQLSRDGGGLWVQIIYMVGVLKRRLPIPRQVPRIMRKLIETCWHQEAAMRPSFEDILPILKVRAHRQCQPPVDSICSGLPMPACPEDQSSCANPA